MVKGQWGGQGVNGVVTQGGQGSLWVWPNTPPFNSGRGHLLVTHLIPLWPGSFIGHLSKPTPRSLSGHLSESTPESLVTRPSPLWPGSLRGHSFKPTPAMVTCPSLLWPQSLSGHSSEPTPARVTQWSLSNPWLSVPPGCPQSVCWRVPDVTAYCHHGGPLSASAQWS